MYEALIADLKNKEKEFVAASKINLDFCRIHGAVEALEAMNAQLTALQAENAELRVQHRTEYCEATGYDCAELGRLREALCRVEAERDAFLTLGPVEELTRGAALVKARDEGRVVVLPCKVGDTVYWMWTDSEGNCEAPIHVDRIYEIRITKNGVELSIQPYDGSIGKVGIHPPLGIFLTCAEAEAALGGGGDGT